MKILTELKKADWYNCLKIHEALGLADMWWGETLVNDDDYTDYDRWNKNLDVANTVARQRFMELRGYIPWEHPEKAVDLGPVLQAAHDKAVADLADILWKEGEFA